MNKLASLFTATIILTLTIFLSCGGGGGDDTTPAKEDPIADQLKVLLNNGTAFKATNTSVKLDNNPTEGWEGFTVKFTGSGNGGSYTTEGRPGSDKLTNVDAVWPANGTWEFADSSTAGQKDPNKMTRNDGETLNISVSSDKKKITLTFTIEDPNAGGRTNGVTGTWVFELPI